MLKNFTIKLNETEPEPARREYITRTVILFTFSIASAFTVISLIVYLLGRLPIDTFIIYLTISVILFAALLFAKRGYWKKTGIIPPILMYFPAIHANYIGGIDAPGNFLYALLIMFVAIIYSYKKMWIALFICLATYLFLAWMISTGYIKPFRSGDMFFINRVLITTGCLISIAFLIWILGRSYSFELEERIKTEKLLNIKNVELASVNEELQATIEELEATNEEFEAINNELLRSQGELLESNEKLKQSEQKFFQIFHSSPVPMSLNDLNTGVYIELNEALTRLSGFTRDDLIGKTPLEAGFFKKEQIININKTLLKTGYLKNQELKTFLKKSREITILMNSFVADIESRKCIISTSIDITEKKAYEESLIKTQRLESLGLIAGGLAHDFNNIMMGILGNLSLARLNLDKPEDTLTFIDNSEEACIRAQGLTRQLLTFSKGGIPVKSIFNPEKIILNSVKFNLAGSKVKAETNIKDGLWNIEADDGQIGQVVNNLLLNAVQSMPSGGIINITLENHTIRAEDISMLSTGLPKPGNFVRLIIADSGKGIADKDLTKIFDPYFTTKQSGSGLGLSVVYSIISNHGGYINVTSEESLGTVFSVYLPAADLNKNKTADEASSASDTDRNSSGSKNNQDKENIKSDLKLLIMDDEDSILSVLKGMLSYIGYKSDGAKSGSEAIALYKKSLASEHPYAAVIMDLTIPGDIGGKEAILLLKEIDPNVKAIVSSGYSDDPVFSDHSSYGFNAILRKPFGIEDLSDALKKTLR